MFKLTVSVIWLMNYFFLSDILLRSSRLLLILFTDENHWTWMVSFMCEKNILKCTKSFNSIPIERISYFIYSSNSRLLYLPRNVPQESRTSWKTLSYCRLDWSKNLKLNLNSSVAVIAKKHLWVKISRTFQYFLLNP